MTIMRDDNPLEDKALGTIEKHRMTERGDRVVVGVSGGPDSVALLLFLSRVSGRLAIDLNVFHLDHMFRGADSSEDASFVARLAESLGVPARVIAVDLPCMLDGSGRSPQDLAREVRLARLEEYAREVGAERIALGHTADDQVETFLMRVVQGAGLTGLSGMAPVSGRKIRPLIGVWRTEVLEYCRYLGVEPRWDASNESSVYLRNRVRIELVPRLVEEFGNSVKEVILREVESLAADNELLGSMASEAFGRVAVAGVGEVRIDLDGLMGLPLSLRRRVIREAWSALLPRATNLSWQHVDDTLRKVALGASGASLDLPHGAAVERRYGELVIGASGRAVDRAQCLEGEVLLTVPGRARIPGASLVLTAETVTVAGEPFARGADTALVRADAEVPLRVRAPVPGDRFHPLGAPGPKKISDFFTDIKLPRDRRAACPLVLSGGEIVWVAGYRLDERFKVPEGAGQAIELRMLPED